MNCIKGKQTKTHLLERSRKEYTDMGTDPYRCLWSVSAVEKSTFSHLQMTTDGMVMSTCFMRNLKH